MRNPNIRVIVVQMSEDLARLENPIDVSKPVICIWGLGDLRYEIWVRIGFSN